MVKDVCLDKYSVLPTLQSKRIPAVGIHENEFDILFLVEIPVFIHELIIIGVQMFA